MIYCDFSESVYNSVKPNGPVLENTSFKAFATPIEKRGFVMSKFWGLLGFKDATMVSGGMGKRVTCAARLRACFSHPVHPMR